MSFSEFIDWRSKSVDVLLNPRMPWQERESYTKKLKHGFFPGHLWFTTSGTTGAQKFVALSKEAILISAQAVNSHFDITEKDRWLNVLPTFHVGGVGVFARAYLSGSKVFDLYAKKRRWNAVHFIQALVETEATLTAVVPAQIFDVVQLKQKAPSTLRVVIVGGGAIDSTLFQEAMSLGWNLYPSYGLTECSSQVATCDKSSWPLCYKILDHMDLKIDDDGYLCLKSESLLSSYAVFHGASVFFQDPKVNGWFKTEDRGKKNGGGLQVFGRDKNFVKVGGESVYLDQLEFCFNRLKMKYKSVGKAMLVADENARLGQVISLCIEGEYTKNVDALVREYNQSCLPFERIKNVYTVDKISISPLGKVKRGCVKL